MPVAAQEADQSASAGTVALDEAIVVTGIRETIQNSINVKRNETAIVDALSAQDIGDLPALSIGEALQTITGATTHREKGGASEIALRGLGSFLSNATFNGREATNGSGDRAVNFNQFPSELMNTIKIYKSQQANLVEGGVAGTIEMGTLRPLDYGKRRIQAEVKGSYSPYQDRIKGSDPLGWRGTLSYVDQYETGIGDIGVSLGVQRNKVSNPEETFAGSSTWVACDATAVSSGNCSEVSREDAAAGAPFFLAPNSLTFRQISEEDKRDAVFGAIQWQPGSRWDVNLDLQYSNRKYAEERHDLVLSETRRGLENYIVNESGVLQYVEGDSSLESTSSLLERNEEYLGGGMNVNYQATDRLTLNFDVSYSHTKRVEYERSTRLRSDSLDIHGNRTPVGNQRVGYIYDVRDSYAPIITIDPRFDLHNHDLFSDDARLRRDQNQRENEIFATRFDAGYELDGFISRLDAGVRFSRQTYKDFDDRVEITQDDRDVDRDVNLACRTEFPQKDYLKAAPGEPITSWATFDPLCLFRGYLGTDDPGRNDDIRAVGNRDVTEEVWAGYMMASYESALGDLPIRGNFGVRVVNTKVKSIGLRSALDVVSNPDGSVRLVEAGDFESMKITSENTRFLPSINAIFDLREDLMLRLAGYRAMSRAAPSSLGAGRSIRLEDGTSFTSVEDAIGDITANGSPRLKPIMSWNLDASLEYYLNRDSMFSAAVYYKTFNGGYMPVLLSEEFNIGGQQVTVPVSQIQNSSEKSRIYGLELTLTNRFSWLPAPLDGLGTKISYSYANANFKNHDIRLGDVVDPESGAVTPGMIPAANLSGYSKHVLSAQAYYQLENLTLQAIYNYRSNYYQDFVGGNSQLRYVRGNDTVDLRASYNLSDNVSLRFEALNLFDEPKITDMPVKGSVRQYHYYGPRYHFGVRVRL